MINTNLFVGRSLQFYALAALFYNGSLQTTQSPTPPITFASTPVDATTLALTITIAVPLHAHLYRDYITISVDNPAITITDWTSEQESRLVYDKIFKTTKKVFEQDITLSLQAHLHDTSNTSARLHVTYYISSNRGMTHTSFPLVFPNKESKQVPPAPKNQVEDTNALSARQSLPTTPSYTERISSLITQTNRLWVRLLLVFLLGILMSLTPCIYPMIPITVGILQAQGSKSILKNLLLSLAYTIGIATTFALLGLAAATTGQLFGSFMANPLVILFIVVLLAYLGLAMFGFYEMYVPSFLQQRSTQSGQGSLSAAFLFGIASGTVASPCLSPGLVLLLSIVTTLKSKLMGFLLLFMFGIGLSLPLLIIGTFSSSLALLPRAGMWMIEIKKLFGFMLFGMCFYFLKPLIPAPYLLGGLAIFLCGAGIFYLYNQNKGTASLWRSITTIIGILLIVGSCIIGTQAYKAYLETQTCDVDCSVWQTNYAHALADAQACNKKLFIDVGASFCSICTAIDKKVFAHNKVNASLKHFCCVKIDGAHDPDNVCKLLQDKYGMVGFPTFLLIDPMTGALIKRWGSELYEVNPEQFAQELATYA